MFSTSAAEEAIRDDKGAVRMDGNSRIGSLAAYYFLDDYNVDDPYPTGEGGANVPGFNALNSGRAQLLALSDTKTFGANTVNLARLSYMRNAANVGVPQGGVGPRWHRRDSPGSCRSIRRSRACRTRFSTPSRWGWM